MFKPYCLIMIFITILNEPFFFFYDLQEEGEEDKVRLYSCLYSMFPQVFQ